MHRKSESRLEIGSKIRVPLQFTDNAVPRDAQMFDDELFMY